MIDVIESQSSGPMLVKDTCSPRFERSNSLIKTEKDVSIFLKGLEKSMVNFGVILSLIREEFDDCELLDFRIHRRIDALNVPAVGMHFCEKRREDPRNLETGGNLYGSKVVRIIAVCGINHRKMVNRQTFRISYLIQSDCFTLFYIE
jgi:hypothetical protein